MIIQNMAMVFNSWIAYYFFIDKLYTHPMDFVPMISPSIPASLWFLMP